MTTRLSTVVCDFGGVIVPAPVAAFTAVEQRSGAVAGAISRDHHAQTRPQRLDPFRIAAIAAPSSAKAMRAAAAVCRPWRA